MVFLAAAKVGGIVANNTLRAEFLYDNLAIAANVIQAAHLNGAEKLMFLGSSCIYPKLAPQPMREDALLTGPLEPTNESYAIAKIAGIKMAEAYRSQYGCDFISVMPTNLYGPGDNYHPEYSHVVAALIRRFHEAKLAGAPRCRGLGHRHAAARIPLCRRHGGCLRAPDEDLFAAARWSISAPARTSRSPSSPAWWPPPSATTARSAYDTSRPDGTPRKLLDVSRLAKLGWRAHTSLEDGIRLAYQAYLSEHKQAAE